MNRDDIIRMAREAGISKPWDQEPVKWEALERFASLVVAAERKAYANNCKNDSLVVHPSDDDWYYANKLKANNG